MWIFIALVMAVLSFLFYDTYFMNHEYYAAMIANKSNWIIFFWGIVFALIPALYLWLSKKVKWWWILSLFFLWYIFFFWFVWAQKWDYMWAWSLFGVFNFLIVFVFLVFLIVGFYSVWNKSVRAIKLQDSDWNSVVPDWLLMITKIGLWSMLVSLFCYVMVIFWVLDYLYPVLLLFILSAIFFSWNDIKHEVASIEAYLSNLNFNQIFSSVYILLLTCSFLYMYFWMYYTFIPYPTAWDANHAYMFFPKIWWENGGYIWWVKDVASVPVLWETFLAWVYKLMGWTWFSADTWMIVVNFLWWIFVLLFGIVGTKVMADSLSEEKNRRAILWFMWWLMILWWLTSGMGAFLVFVDNKTDLAMLSVTMLWMILGIYAMLQRKKLESTKRWLEIVLWLAWFFFATANMIKPTANFDVFSIWLLLSIVWFGILTMLALVLIAVWALSFLNINRFEDIVPKNMGVISLALWTLLWTFDVVKIWLREKRKVISIMCFALTFFVTIFVFKWTYLAMKVYYWWEVDWKWAFHYILMVNNDTKVDSNKSIRHNLACAWVCTADMYDDLYTWLQEIIWDVYSEDNWRYQWYGQKQFDNPWWWGLFPNNSFSFKSDSNEVSFARYMILDKKDYNWFRSYTGTNQLIINLKDKIQLVWSWNKVDHSLIIDEVNEINKRLDDNLIAIVTTKDQKTIKIPYKYIVPFNVTFNWSLQNRSSYYTDIGVTWLILFALVIVWFFYSIFRKDLILFAFSTTTIIWWIIWWFLASWIVWYGIGGIMMLIFTNLVLFSRIKADKNLFGVIAATFWLVVFVGIFINFIRISTQWWSGPFIWYKWSSWEIQDLKLNRGSITMNKITKTPFKMNDVFALQFGHYRRVIRALENREDWEKAILAGTYMRYFLKNQRGVEGDQFLTNLWQLFSDDDSCKSHLRLKDKWIKYVVIDPNIWTVVMWWWNMSLWYRFFAKINTVTWKLDDHGVLSMLAKLVQEWNMKLKYTNNIAIKYWFILTNEEISNFIGWEKDEDQIALLRAKLITTRFWSNKQKYIDVLWQTVIKRIKNWKFIEDLADMSWYDVDYEKLNSFINPDKKYTEEELNEVWESLWSEWRVLIWQFLNVRRMLADDKNKDRLVEIVSGMIWRSVGSSSQIMFLEVK